MSAPSAHAADESDKVAYAVFVITVLMAASFVAAVVFYVVS